mmetsp:Transcript_3854/g.5855  ORF Transcript_3854/g.5855 Transcript_3854/m.5855 type:complete len:85 (+) Transcript_3854:253-507(+)
MTTSAQSTALLWRFSIFLFLIRLNGYFYEMQNQSQKEAGGLPLFPNEISAHCQNPIVLRSYSTFLAAGVTPRLFKYGTTFGLII